jgi:hypothetical protein
MNVSKAEANSLERERERAKRRPRSAVTSGRKLLVTGNPNSAWSRRYADLVRGHCSDLGGRDLLSEAQLSLIRRAAALECELEQMDGRLSQGEAVNLDQYGRAASHLRRLFETLGIRRQPRDVTPSLSDYLAQIQAEDEAKASEAAEEQP